MFELGYFTYGVTSVLSEDFLPHASSDQGFVIGWTRLNFEGENNSKSYIFELILSRYIQMYIDIV